MNISEFEKPASEKLAKINETLDTLYGFKVYDTIDIKKLYDVKKDLKTKLQELESSMPFNAYSTNAKYMKHLLLAEAVDKMIEAKKKDHDKDGDIDSDDYMAAKDKAIKKAMGKKVKEGGVGNMKLEMEEDAEHMSKAEFIKTHGQRYAYIWDRVRKDMKGDPRTNENRVNEGRLKDEREDMEADASDMSKAEFIKAHGQANAYIWDRVQAREKGQTNEELTAKQKKLPAGLQKAIAKKQGNKPKDKVEEKVASLKALLEQEVEKAEIVIAAKSLVDELQDMIEQLGKMQNDELGAVVDQMSYQYGADKASSFNQSVSSQLDTLLDSLKSAKEAVNNEVLVLTGEAPAQSDMAPADSDLGDMETDADAGTDLEAPADDLTGGDDSASGPEENPLGRAEKA